VIRRAAAAALLLSLVAAMAAPPAAAVTVSDYQKWRHATRTLQATPTGLIEVRIGGILRGLAIANRKLTAAGGAVLYCRPDSLKDAELTSKTARKMLDDELKSPSRPRGAPWPAKTRISAVLLHILQRTWSCPAGKQMLR